MVMEITLRELKNHLSIIKEELLDKPVYLEAPNGLMVEPKIKFKTIYLSLELSKENVDSIIITYE